MFKKSNRQFRQRARKSEESDEESVKAPPTQATENKSPKLTTLGDVCDAESSQSNDSFRVKDSAKPSTKLSFAEDEDEAETFVVKKSVQSRRLERSQKKLLKSALKNSANVKETFDPLIAVPSTSLSLSPTISTQSLDANKEAEKIGEIITFEDEDDSSEVKFSFNSRRRETKKLAHATSHSTFGGGSIPDADLIYKLKKQRAQMARIANEEYIPLDDNNGNEEREVEHRSRLVREDDDDHSEDDDDHDAENGNDIEGTKGRFEFGRIDYKTKERRKAKEIIDLTQEESEIAKTEKIRRRIHYDSDDDDGGKQDDGEDSSQSDDSDDPIERWEEEQIRKAVRLGVGSYASELAAQQQSSKEDENVDQNLKDNYEVIEIEVDQPSKPSSIRLPSYILERQAARTRGDAFNFEALQQNITELKQEINEEIDNANIQYNQVMKQFKLTSQRELELPSLFQSAKGKVAFYQKFDKFVTKFTKTINEESGMVSQFEEEMLQIMEKKAKRQAERCTERRRDVQQASALCYQLMAKYRQADSHSHQAYSIANIADNNENASRLEQTFSLQLENETQLLEDENIDFSGIKDWQDYCLQYLKYSPLNDNEYEELDNLVKQFEEWRLINPDEYVNNFGDVFLKKCLRPLIRFEILYSNLTEPEKHNFVTNFQTAFSWLRGTIMFALPDGKSTMIPELLEEFVLDRLVKTVQTEEAYDVFSTKQTNNLVKCLKSIFDLFPTILDFSQNVPKLLQKVMEKFEKAIEQDVFIPQVVSAEFFAQKQATSIASKVGGKTRAMVIREFVLGFFKRQFWRTTRLMANVIAWREVIHEQFLQELAIERLLNRYLLTSILQTCNDTEGTIEKMQTLTRLIPWKLSDEPKLKRFGEVVDQICLNPAYSNEDKEKLEACKNSLG